MVGKLETIANKNEKVTRNQGEEGTNTILKHLGQTYNRKCVFSIQLKEEE